MRNFEKPTRSVAVSARAMAATSHPSATLTAINILQAGGNAMDAAIAACAVQCVVEPGSTGIGGDCFALYAPRGGADVIAYNGSGRTPAALTVDWFEERGLTEVPRQSPSSVTVPGAIDAWTRLHADHGRLPFAKVLAPAITFAETGYAISPRVHHDWVKEERLLAADEAAARIFLPQGRAPRVGEIHRQPELAATFDRIATEGRDGFYRGPVAEDIVERLRALGGLHTLEDFAAARGEYVTPVTTTFRDYTIHECPPNGQGIIALMILNILSHFEAAGAPDAIDRIHIEIEATRLAYAARDAWLADPAKSDVPVEEMLSDEFAGRLASMIDLTQAIADLPPFELPRHRDTVYISVVDSERNSVSFINSIFDSFGTGIVAPKSGVILHNRGQSFSLKRGHLNMMAPEKRPLHTIIPGMVTRNGRTEISFGVMGGYYQAMGHAHLISKVLDYGMDMQDAIDLPRLVPASGLAPKIEVEQTVPAATIAELQARGFEIVPTEDPIGGAQVIRIDWENGTLTGGSESRKDGVALGL
ncbi:MULTISPECIES: gamma-glutamyltransferase [Rhizobium]|jgi:gamma-glutamyltranspeptidase/glutathione hydrolase|uniref:Glutathione hydrolase proenzyme n=1 Tax=Rhizobium lusitanum TaxID=293958 RepID=A0A1C3WTA6_9HYPH|nr:gamma-glutamyltransferase [Rhizobium lusitanum]SCB43277.1 gamma-glutamyltranspeptidase / glutathione hydrolase [Rhizobium lusitanum]